VLAHTRGAHTHTLNETLTGWDWGRGMGRGQSPSQAGGPREAGGRKRRWETAMAGIKQAKELFPHVQDADARQTLHDLQMGRQVLPQPPSRFLQPVPAERACCAGERREAGLERKRSRLDFHRNHEKAGMLKTLTTVHPLLSLSLSPNPPPSHTHGPPASSIPRTGCRSRW
jgi:hypothetical protein